MSRMYTDHLHETTLTIPDKFIDVKTGESQLISTKIQDQIEYHSNNNTLIHLVFSALHQYLHPQIIQNGGTNEILFELYEIKKMMQQRSNFTTYPMMDRSTHSEVMGTLDLEEIEDILEAFGG